MSANDARLQRLLEQKERAQEKAKELDRKIQGIRAKEQAKERKLDTRRKVLVGALILDEIEHDEALKSEVMAKLERFLTRDTDRALFGFPLKSEQV